MLRPVFRYRLRWTEPLVMLLTVAQWLALSTIAGVVIGIVCPLFLRGLFAIEGRLYDAPTWVLWLTLPLGGFANGLLLHYGYRIRSHHLADSTIVAVNKQRGFLPFRTIWIKPLAALITLGCGGSAGKEGPCSHIGGSVAAAIGRVLGLNREMRKRLLACGVSAGFASVFGTPLTGAIYGVEMLAIGRLRHDFLFPGIVAGIAAYRVSLWMGLPYPQYRLNFPYDMGWHLFFQSITLGVLCGAVSWIFIEIFLRLRTGASLLRKRFSLWPPLIPLLGGLTLALLMTWGPRQYLGLSLPVMDQALAGAPQPWNGFLWKAILVGITLGSGFYGGIVTPQFVIGTLAGSAFAPWLGLSPALGAGIGMCAVVASASNAPIAAILMSVEMFGAPGLLPVAVASVTAYLISGHRSVYPEQQIAYSKSSWILAHEGLPVGKDKVQLSNDLPRWKKRI